MWNFQSKRIVFIQEQSAVPMAESEETLSYSLRAGSSDDTNVCHICPNVQASAFCPKCKIYLCPACVVHHKLLPPTASHKLLEGDTMPSFHTRHASDTENIKKCPDHPAEKIKFYCPAHKALCCCACNVKTHGQCRKEYILDICQGFGSGTEYKTLTADIQTFGQKAKQFLADIDICLKAVKELGSSEIEKLRKYKALIIAYLDKREKELINEIELLRDQDTTTLNDAHATIKKIQTEINNCMLKLKVHEDSSHELFIASKKIRDDLSRLQSSLSDINVKTMHREYMLRKDPLVERLLACNNTNGLAQLVFDRK